MQQKLEILLRLKPGRTNELIFNYFISLHVVWKMDCFTNLKRFK